MKSQQLLNEHPMAKLHIEHKDMPITEAARLHEHVGSLHIQFRRAFADSIRQLYALENPSVPFRSARSDRDDGLPELDVSTTIETTAKVAKALKSQPGPIEVADGPNLAFVYVDREIYTTRKLAPGHKGRIMDFLLKNSEDDTPVFAELKTTTDKSALAALVQLLRYTAELSTPPQRRRLAQQSSRDFDGVDFGTCRFDLYLLLQTNERSRERLAIIDITKQVAIRLMGSPEVSSHVRRIACLEVPTDLDGGRLCLAKRWVADEPGPG